MPASPVPSFREALHFWWKLGWISFGGPTGQIAIMHREVVERNSWVDEKRFLHALNYCMLLPGPEAQQLATFLGWYLHGVRGGVCAGVLFVLPSAFILWALSLIYVWYGSVPIIAAAFHGLVPAIIAIVFHAMLKLGGKTLRDTVRWIVAIAAAVLITFFHDSYPLVVLGAGLVGWIFHHQIKNTHEADQESEKQKPIQIVPLIRTALVCLALWFAPLLAFGLWLGWGHTVVQEGIFFSKAALITFGGAYAVLPYVAQHAVDYYHWLTPEQMLHGFGLAETTPGPLIMVLQFIGFLGGWHQPGSLSPLTAATLGSFLTTWVTFAPSFLFILVGAPFVERLIHVAALQSAMSAVSAAVVGVMANFALWFALHAIFPAGAATHPDWFVLLTGLATLFVLGVTKIDIPIVIGLCALLGVILHLAGIMGL
ncbi:MAG: chromate efflux transporter [Methylacidiphilales bacterium]|nr:chromate efflux transporter [Candidatus Methylacidiphilales bacterium]